MSAIIAAIPETLAGGVIETVVDQVVQADVVVAWHSYGAGRAITTPQYPGGNANGYEGKCEQDWGELDHGYPKITARSLQSN